MTDATNFATDLRAWMDRMGLNTYTAPVALGVARSTLNLWLAGSYCKHERAYRALMAQLESATRSEQTPPPPDPARVADIPGACDG